MTGLISGFGVVRRVDPFFVFAIIAAAIFVITSVSDGEAPADKPSYDIEVTEPHIAALRASWTEQKGSPPSEEELAVLIADFIEEEIFFREALRLGLGDGDTIVRRRLAQKMAFIIAHETHTLEPSEQELRQHYADNKSAYGAAATISFRQIFFSDARRDNPAADAAKALRDMSGTDKPIAFGDPSMAPERVAQADAVKLTGWFGSAFASEVMSAPVGEWCGPVTSAYGSHLIYVEAIAPASLRSFETVREAVKADYSQARRLRSRNEKKAAIIARYNVYGASKLAEAQP